MINVIVAFNKNRVIGNKGQIPWNLKEDKLRFKTLTINNIVIMGRKTYESIGFPLPDRINLVISKTKNFSSGDLYTFPTFLAALEYAKKLASGSNPEKEIFICGGERVYKEALPFAQRLFLTEVSDNSSGEAFFPLFDEKLFCKTEETEIASNPPCVFRTFIKN